ncbi:MAG: YkgJ family cysteine cluster protein [Candidatus Bathyarchaeota archaeon]|nr:MAG: YkgJ family cysteine cluster protein [Candidatus Bathyarchaeota archaeon]
MHSWSCVACGKCCLGYRVPLKLDEYAKVARVYGIGVLEFGLGKVYLKNSQGNRCVFQRPSLDRWVCSLQAMKPLACKLFPFRIQSKPAYKRGDTSAYRFRGNDVYVYMDPECDGIRIGKPSRRFRYEVLPEILQIGFGERVKQKYTTSKYISWTPS